MVAISFQLPIILIGGAVVILAMVLTYRLLNRDPSVQRTRWGFFVERDHYSEEEEEGETWTVDPLPPPPSEAPTRIDWPRQEKDEGS